MSLARLLNRLAGASAVAGVVGGILYESLYTVEGGHRGVIWDRFNGVQVDKVIGEGTHVRIPFLQYPTMFDIRMRPRVISTRTGTKDLQMVTISLRVLARPIPEKLPVIFKELGEDYAERVLPSIVNEVLKAQVARLDAEQLLTQREEVSADIRNRLEERAAEFHILLDDVSITHLSFGTEFASAAEAKVVASQEAEKAKFAVQMAEQTMRASILEAEGEAEAARLVSAALQEHGDAVIHVKRIEAARDIAKALARSRNVSYIPSSSGGSGAAQGGGGTGVLLGISGRN